MKQRPKQIKTKNQDTEKKTEKRRNLGNSAPKRHGAARPKKTTESEATKKSKSLKEEIETSEMNSKNQNTLITPSASNKAAPPVQEKLPEELGSIDSNIDAH